MFRIITVLFLLTSSLLVEPVVAGPLPALPVLPVEAHKDWQAIGRLNVAGFSTRSMCSGTLIAPDLVLTAAHCVLKPDLTPHSLANITFVAGWLRGTYVASSKPKKLTLHPRALKNGRVNRPHDIALITLQTPINLAGPVLQIRQASAQPNAQPELAIVGYVFSRPHMLSARFDCPGQETALGLVVACPTQQGNSGGPILEKTTQGWRVVGVVSAGSDVVTLGAVIDEFTSPWLGPYIKR